MTGDSPHVVSDTIRYQDKSIGDRDWIVEFLANQKSGVLGLIDEETPHLLTQLFVYDNENGAIYMHGAQGGRAYGIVEATDEARACFTTSDMGRFIPADQPVNFTVEYASVVAYGSITVIENPDEKRRVLEEFMSKFAPHLTPGEDYGEMSEESVGRTAVYRFDVESWSAKQGQKDPDHPGAYNID